jgi:hypothetical protein
MDDKHQRDNDKLIGTDSPEINLDNRSDANDGVERPLGYYSSQAQADRSLDLPGETPTDEVAGGPSYYSAEQQISRNSAGDLGKVRGRPDPHAGADDHNSLHGDLHQSAPIITDLTVDDPIGGASTHSVKPRGNPAKRL